MLLILRFRGHENSIFFPSGMQGVCSEAVLVSRGAAAWCAPWSVGAGAAAVVSRPGGGVPLDAAGICYSEQAVQSLLTVWGLC